MVEQYVRLDEQISKLEGTCPGPRMATAEAWVEHIQSKHEAMLRLDGMGVSPLREREWETEEALPIPAYTMGGRQGDPIVANTPTKDLAQVNGLPLVNVMNFPQVYYYHSTLACLQPGRNWRCPQGFHARGFLRQPERVRHVFA